MGSGLQLKAEQKIKVQLDKWPDHLDKWGGPPDEGRAGIEEDRACIMFKRDARTLLGDEQLLVGTIWYRGLLGERLSAHCTHTPK